MKNKLKLALIISSISLINISCDNSKDDTTISANTTTTNNTTIQGDTAKKDDIGELVKAGSEIINEVIENKKKNDSIREANEPHIWVYQIGDSYNDDDLVAKAYDKLKETEDDIYVFRQKRKRFLLIKGYGNSLKELLADSTENIQRRTHARVEIIDLSKECKKLPTNTRPIKYKIDGEKKEADCKECE